METDLIHSKELPCHTGVCLIRRGRLLLAGGAGGGVRGDELKIFLLLELKAQKVYKL